MRYSKLLLDIVNNRRLLWELIKKNFKTKYLGSYLGILWAFIQPAITVLIFWFVFQVGFKSMPVDNFPFILWLVCGMFPWFFFSDALNSATTSIVDNGYLVKKVVFRVSLLPMVQIISALFVHVVFIFVLFFMFLVYGYMPNLYSIQLFYYLFALTCFTFGLSLITSTLIIFLKDVGQILAMILQFGFWATPIFWSLKLIPEQYQWIIKCNPMFYIVEGYRNAFIYHKWFWELGYTNIGFWFVTIIIMFSGISLFKKLRPHFADVL
ncbi:ABC transporter permease [Desulforamulus aeronauticus]|uniref:Transport permease protein n=1 Tax=Desulforamulus aeronauticus DSM 10349 TaxID=1121421 RepID=A0A1M6T4Q1_9FIRM|nr:ABC transporter permease [Desulforamulus aeronauticus]SHK51890.1 teichoic acid transport system permease protein [Desulforamulus aeronauticus DSM 10349]